MATRTFLWITLGGGVWSLAANWDDLTDGISPSQVTPGTQDSVTVAGPTGTAVQTLTGNGSVGAAIFTGNTILAGTLTVANLTAGLPASGGLLQLAAGTSLSSTTATLAAGSLLVNGAATKFSQAGQFNLGSAGSGPYGASANLSVTSGGTADVLGVLMNTVNCQIYVDPTSIMEVGTLGTGAAGRLTVDPGSMLSGQGDADAYGALANNGTIQAKGGTLALGAVSGTGSLVIAAGATMQLHGASGAGETVGFAGANGDLDLLAEAYAPAGTLTGFAPGDTIDFSGSLISGATFVATNGTAGGVLTLYYGNQVAAKLTLTGNFTNSTFVTSGDGAGGTLINVANGAAGGGTPSPGTSTQDQYLWIAPASGAWKTAANWQDTTTGASPAAVAPGVNDSVTFAASQTAFSVVAGPANAASIGITGDIALTGAFTAGTLSIGQVTGSAFTPGALDITAGASVSAGTAAIGAGAISVAGSAALLNVSGTLTLGGGISGVGLPVTALTATQGGRVRAGSIAIGGGSGDSITTDPTGSVEIGTLGTASAGTVTVDPGATLTGNGSVNPLGAVVDNGSIQATGNVLTLGSVTGTGALSIGAGAALELSYATALPINFTSASSTLAFAGSAAAPTGTLSGIGPGDVIDFLGSPVTNVQFAENSASNGGTLLLLYNGTIVARLLTTNSVQNLATVVTPDGFGGADILFTTGTGGGGGTGQTGTDPLVWNGSFNGNWSNPVNWTDTVTKKTATLPPGAQTPAQIAGPTGTNFETIGGTGTCASLFLTGNVYWFGNLTTGTLSIGTDGTATTAPSAGTIVTAGQTTLTAGQALVADGALEISGSKTVMDVTGTLALGDGGVAPSLSFGLHATGQLGGLSLGGGSVAIDNTASLEIGFTGGAALGAVTVDPGFSASGNGTLNPLGAVVDNGTITASGGTLVLGPTSGTGSLAIGTEATLLLTGATTPAIAMTGAGSTLDIGGTAPSPAGVISGFAPGDSMLTGSTPVSAATYLPGAGGVGTLTLSEAGQTVFALELAGNYAGDTFAVQQVGQQAGAGAEITVTSPGSLAGNPPQGTVSPDQYVWTGADGSVLWSDPGNWTDVSQSQTPALVAPGQNDVVSISIPAGHAQLLTGPANAAAVSIGGTATLGGVYGIGTLSIGTAQQSGLLGLASGDTISAASATVLGGILGQGGTLLVGGTLALGQAAQGGGLQLGLVSATGTTFISAAAAVLQGAGSVLSTDTLGSIEIGGAQGAGAGSVTVDPSGTIYGQGGINPSGKVVDNGFIVASGGTLVLGSASGTGTVLVGVDSGVVLDGGASAGLTVDFAAGGTLSLAGTAACAAGIEDFGPSDSILLPVSGATSASYAATGAGQGVLTILNGSTVLSTLTLLGSQADLAFSVTGSAGGGTTLTATPANTAGVGGTNVSTYPSVTGGFQITTTQLHQLAPFVPQTIWNRADPLNDGHYEYFLAGDTTVVGGPLFDGAGPAGMNVEVIGPVTGQVGPYGFGPGSNIVLAAGYAALIAEGVEPLGLIDQGNGNSLIVGNAGNDTIAAAGNNDTMVGATGANTVFYASGGAGVANSVSILGGGNDTITSYDNSSITTSGGQSGVFLGAASDSVMSYGSDEIVCNVTGIGNDTVTGMAPAGMAGDTVFGPAQGSLIYNGGGAAATVVGAGGQVVMTGGAGNGNELWAGTSYAQYQGGAGSAVIVGGSQGLFVQGGSGAMTVYGGTGVSLIDGSPGSSTYVVGAGPSTISAAAGNTVWLDGAAPVSVAGAAGVDAFGGLATGNNIFQANAGSETLWGGAGNDEFFAGSGNGTFVSGGGADVFSFTDGITAGGSNDIVGFVAGTDTIALHGYGSVVPTLNVINGSTYFTLGDGTKVELYGVTNVTASSFTTT